MASNTRTSKQGIVYLVTYSRADLSKIPDRQTFALAVKESFEHLQVANVQHWAVSQENHATATRGQSIKHYHMALKLTSRMRWARVKQYLESSRDIRVHFSDEHNTYYSAYKYVTKEDEDYLLSENHPNLQDPPSTEQAIAANKAKGKKIKKKTTKKRKRYSTSDVVDIIRQNKIKTRLELINLAMVQKEQGKSELSDFIANRGRKVVNEALDLAKEFDDAPEALARLQKTRIQLLEEAYTLSCSDECKGQWLHCALDVLNRNEICTQSFCNSVYKALLEGRGKYKNVYISGPANTGKTFLVSPLKTIYRSFVNPATGTFAWVGAEEAEVIILNDFRWHPSIIAWGDFLQLLEGDIVHLPAPKSFASKDIEFNKDTPFFATSDSPIVLIKGGNIDQANTQMMAVRWRHFNLWRPIPEQDQKRIAPCPGCFSRFILDYKDINDITSSNAVTQVPNTHRITHQ